MSIRTHLEELYPHLTATLDAELWFWQDVEAQFAHVDKDTQDISYTHGYEEGREQGHIDYEQIDTENAISEKLLAKEVARWWAVRDQ